MTPCCPWYENPLRVLELFGVPRKAVIWVNAEDAYDTVTEARVVGKVLLDREMKSVIVTTSKSHTRRAHHIWKKIYGDKLKLFSVAAKDDPFDPKGWWKDGEQVRWVLAEYGGWIYYFWKRSAGASTEGANRSEVPIAQNQMAYWTMVNRFKIREGKA